MKFYNKAIFPAVVMAMVGATSCNDLDTLPQGQYITSEQKGEAIASNPELAKSGVIAITANFIPFCQTYVDESHNDFGWPASMIYLDHHASDMVGNSLGYNWFRQSCALSDITSNGECTAITWYTLYRQIDSANAVLENIDPETTEPELLFFRSQALAMRANAYFILAQMYQHTYKGHESLPCVPIIDLSNRATAAVDGVARSTVQEVYDFILNDINGAIDDLNNCGITPSDVIDAGAKRLVNLGTALGIRARVNLVMQNWTAAAQDARAAISASGATPYSIEEVNHPTFQKMTEHAWMWGIYIDEQNRLVTSEIVNWPSHMGSLNYGYASVGAWRSIDINLYNKIPATDVRKGWFLDKNGQSTSLTPAQQNYATNVAGIPPYAQVKFAPYQDVLYQSTNANDVPLMRVEEMYLIEAEATAMGGNAEAGRKLLEDFVKTYRNPEYVLKATTSADVQEAAWLQRRIEFWGEGISFFDLVRLRKGMDRRGGGWEKEYVYVIEPGSQINVFVIPQSETNRNPLITPDDNNDPVGRPTAVDDYQ